MEKKNELLNMLTDLERILDVKKLKSEKKQTTNIESRAQLVEELHGLYKDCIDVGFTESQAWDITISVLENAIKPQIF